MMYGNVSGINKIKVNLRLKMVNVGAWAVLNGTLPFLLGN